MPGSNEVVLLKMVGSCKSQYSDKKKAEEIQKVKNCILTEFNIISMLRGFQVFAVITACTNIKYQFPDVKKKWKG